MEDLSIGKGIVGTTSPRGDSPAFPPCPHPAGWGPVLWSAYDMPPIEEFLIEIMEAMGLDIDEVHHRMEAAALLMRASLALSLPPLTPEMRALAKAGKQPLVDIHNANVERYGGERYNDAAPGSREDG